MTERELVKETKANVAAAKENLRRAIRNMRKVADINRDADRGKAANVAMRFEGALTQALGIAVSGHADASDGLIEHWPDYDADITTRGGGR